MKVAKANQSKLYQAGGVPFSAINPLRPRTKSVPGSNSFKSNPPKALPTLVFKS